MPSFRNQTQNQVKQGSELLCGDGPRFEAAGRATAGWDADTLIRAYDELPVDPYLPGGATYRQRRFGRFRYAGDGQRLEQLGPAPFVQAPDINAVAGGIERHFEALTPAMRDSLVLDQLLRELVKRLPACPSWRVYVHQIRVSCAETPIHPAPEGVHCDGHDFIALVAIDRYNITGGSNRVFDKNMNLLLETTLTRRFDYLLLDDRRTYHGVSAISGLNGRPGHRDMLVVDFNREEAS